MESWAGGAEAQLETIERSKRDMRGRCLRLMEGGAIKAHKPAGAFQSPPGLEFELRERKGWIFDSVRLAVVGVERRAKSCVTACQMLALADRSSGAVFQLPAIEGQNVRIRSTHARFRPPSCPGESLKDSWMPGRGGSSR